MDVLIVDANTLETFEQLGSKNKFWYDERAYLFKARRPGTGEDWAEVIGALLAQHLGLPHAEYDLAEAINLPGPTDDNPKGPEPRGVRSVNFTPIGGRLILGNELIFPVASSATALKYAHLPKRKRQLAIRKQFHTPSRVAGLLSVEMIGLPPGWDSPVPSMTAKGLMAGYLMLDVLVGNQDRHEENWGLISHEGAVYLAPTFDHASSLGRENQDERRAMKLASTAPLHGVAGYAANASSQLYEKKSGLRLSTIAAFSDYAATCRSEARVWIAQLDKVNEEIFRKLFALIPNTHITDVGREFAVRLLIENKRRLLALEL